MTDEPTVEWIDVTAGLHEVAQYECPNPEGPVRFSWQDTVDRCTEAINRLADILETK